MPSKLSKNEDLLASSSFCRATTRFGSPVYIYIINTMYCILYYKQLSDDCSSLATVDDSTTRRVACCSLHHSLSTRVKNGHSLPKLETTSVQPKALDRPTKNFRTPIVS